MGPTAQQHQEEDIEKRTLETESQCSLVERKKKEGEKHQQEQQQREDAEKRTKMPDKKTHLHKMCVFISSHQEEIAEERMNSTDKKYAHT